MKKFLVLIFVSSNVFATQRVDSKFRASGSNTSVSLGFEYDAENIWTTHVNLTSTRSKVKDSATGETEITRDLQWVNSWDFKNTWYIDLGVGGSNTKVDKIRTGNLDVTVGQNIADLSGLNWGLTLGVNSIKQQESATATPKLTLVQSKRTIQVGANPAERIYVALFWSQYDYDKNVDDQLSRLSDPAAVQQYGTAFSDTLTTLIDHEAGLSFGFYINESWALNLTYSISEEAPTPQVKGRAFDFKLDHQINSDWDASVLVGSTQYDSTTTTPSSRYGYLGLALGYSW